MKFTNDKYIGSLIRQIVARAKELGFKRDPIDLGLDIVATHCNGCPLELGKLLSAPDSDFSHDIAGIINNLDRRTGKLQHFFDPRCSLPNAKMRNYQP